MGKLEYEELVRGSDCAIFVSKSAAKVVSDAKAKEKARSFEILKELSNCGTDNLHSQQLKFEGRYKSGTKGGKKIAVYAVKANQLRIYGGFVEMNGRKFFCVEAAIKKKDKADLSQLQKVAKKLGELNE